MACLNESGLDMYINEIENSLLNEIFTLEELHETQPLHDSIWLKLVALGAYIVILLSSGIALAFTFYEKNYHGHFRTVINQLFSTLLITVSLENFNLLVYWSLWPCNPTTSMIPSDY